MSLIDIGVSVGPVAPSTNAASAMNWEIVLLNNPNLIVAQFISADHALMCAEALNNALFGGTARHYTARAILS